MHIAENVTPEAMMKAAKTAANIADSSATFAPVKINEFLPPNYYPVKTSWKIHQSGQDTFYSAHE